MRALSKLIYLNNPDLVLFVGEALVGNDAVDQLSKFNQVGLIFRILYIVFTMPICYCYCYKISKYFMLMAIHFSSCRN